MRSHRHAVHGLRQRSPKGAQGARRIAMRKASTERQGRGSALHSPSHERRARFAYNIDAPYNVHRDVGREVGGRGSEISGKSDKARG